MMEGKKEGKKEESKEGRKEGTVNRVREKKKGKGKWLGERKNNLILSTGKIKIELQLPFQII